MPAKMPRREEWYAELERINQFTNDEGMTVHELAEATGHSKTWVRERLGKMMAKGELIVGKKIITGIDGKPQLVPVYRKKGK